MKIRYVFDYALPANGANTLQTVKTVEALHRAHADTALWLPASPFEPADILQKKICHYYNVLDPFPIFFVPSNLGKWGAIRKEKIGFPKKLFSNLPQRPDILVTRAWPTALLACKNGIPTYYETWRTFEGVHAVVLNILKYLSRYTAFLGIISHSEYSAQCILRRGYKKDIYVVHNGWDNRSVETQVETTPMLTQLKSDERPLILYCGRLNRHKGINSILQLARYTPGFQYALAGAETLLEQKTIEIACRKLSIQNVRVLPWMSHQQVLPLLRQANFLLIPPTRKPFMTGHTGLPLKIYEYLASGIPIIAPDVPEIKPLLVHEQNCWLLPPDDAPRAASLVETLLDSPDIPGRIAKNQRLAANRYTWDYRARRLLDIFN